ncbi:MAG: SdpI family protein [Bacteroidota bacterium]
MKLSLKNELPAVIIALIPVLYLYFAWNNLPEEVPIHWNFKGEIDRWGSREELLTMTLLLPLGTYLLFLIIPKIDPKGKIKNMGKKYDQFKFLFVFFMSVIAFVLIYSAKNLEQNTINLIYIVLGLLFIFLGNYFQTIKHNYFIGIRTPWTLENETVWKDTHKLGGKLFFFGGMLIIVLSFLFEREIFSKIFLVIILAITLISVIYSYIRFQQIKKNTE